MKKRIPYCPNCNPGYPIQLLKDFKKGGWICPLCKYYLSFGDWVKTNDGD